MSIRSINTWKKLSYGSNEEKAMLGEKLESIYSLLTGIMTKIYTSPSGDNFEHVATSMLKNVIYIDKASCVNRLHVPS